MWVHLVNSYFRSIQTLKSVCLGCWPSTCVYPCVVPLYFSPDYAIPVSRFSVPTVQTQKTQLWVGPFLVNGSINLSQTSPQGSVPEVCLSFYDIFEIDPLCRLLWLTRSSRAGIQLRPLTASYRYPFPTSWHLGHSTSASATNRLLKMNCFASLIWAGFSISDPHSPQIYLLISFLLIINESLIYISGYSLSTTFLIFLPCLIYPLLAYPGI